MGQDIDTNGKIWLKLERTEQQLRFLRQKVNRRSQNNWGRSNRQANWRRNLVVRHRNLNEGGPRANQLPQPVNQVAILMMPHERIAKRNNNFVFRCDVPQTAQLADRPEIQRNESNDNVNRRLLADRRTNKLGHLKSHLRGQT